MEETLRRVMGGPDPAAIAEVVGADGGMVREAIERRRTRGRERRRELRERAE